MFKITEKERKITFVKLIYPKITPLSFQPNLNVSSFQSEGYTNLSNQKCQV